MLSMAGEPGTFQGICLDPLPGALTPRSDQWGVHGIEMDISKQDTS
jgi:hypothetical protein